MTSIVTGETEILGIIGWPIRHSLSPVMQNAALRMAGHNAVYVPFAVAPDDLPNAVAGLRALGVRGFNVTVPHKTAILPLLDRIDDEAAVIGAVNTVHNEDGFLVGYNTDAGGFLRAITTELDFTPVAGDVLLLGAGGAARAAAFALAAAGVARLTIANRTVASALALAAELSERFTHLAISGVPLLGAEFQERLAGCGLLVNTTTVGMGTTAFAGLELAQLPATAVVYDMVYAPPETPLLVAAHRHGFRCANGLGMLVGQGELAYLRWFGQYPPPGIMQESLLTVLGGRSSA